MNNLYSLYVNIGDELFLQGRQEEALAYYQQAYEEGCCDEALARIEERYVLPQEENFRRNYAENCSASKLHFPYENCQIDFIPAGDKKFILFDRKAARFCGSFDIQSYMDKEIPNKTFQSVLIVDHWDAREVLLVLNQYIWNNIYIALNASAEKFMSFFKLPDFASLLPEGVHIFQNTEEMRDYFAGNPDVYLPHVIYSPNQEEYEKLVEDIHQERIQSGAHSSNVFLSICIPSYNRGELALKAVECALQTDYDAEVEIIVSNNHSSIDTEGYQTIQGLRDSRLRYHETEKNVGFGGNIFECLNISNGRFALLFSDEDLLDIEKMDDVFDYLLNADNLGACRFNPSTQAQETWKLRGNKKYKMGGEAFSWASNFKYFTGNCYNVHYLKHYNIIRQLEGMNPTRYIHEYPQCTPMCLLASVSNMEDSGIMAWHYCTMSKTGGNYETEFIISEYTKVSARMEQQAGILRLAEDRLELEDYKVVLLSCPHRTLSSISESVVAGQLKLKRSWPDICRDEYQNCLKIMSESKWGVEAFDSVFFHDFDEVFLDWLDCRRIRPVFSEKENFKATLRAQMARYYWEHGVPFLEINFKAIDEKLDEAISQGLPAGPACLPKGRQTGVRDD